MGKFLLLLIILIVLSSVVSAFYDPIIYYELGDIKDTGTDGYNYFLKGTYQGFDTGIVGNAVELSDAAGDKLENETFSSTAARSFSCIELWLNITNPEGNDRIFSFDSGDYANYYVLMIEAVTKLRMLSSTGIDLQTGAIITANEWMHVVVVNGTEGCIYVNGVCQIDYNNAGAMPTTTGQFHLGSLAADASTYDGLMDNIAFFKENCTPENVTYMYNGGAGRNYTTAIVPPIPSIIVSIDTPLDGQTFNDINLSGISNRFYINGTHDNDIETNCTINDTRFSNTSFISPFNFSFVNVSLLENQVYYIDVYCNRSGTTNGTGKVYFTIDTVNPTITINPNNAFTTTNKSTVNQYGSFFPINISFYDKNLYQYEINITKDGTIYFNYTNTTMTDTNTTYYHEVDISDWDDGLYDIEITASDSHTALSIDDYDIEKGLNKLIFDTKEKNKIEISSVGAIGTFYNKNFDRYSFGFDYLLSDNKRTFILKSNKKIIYLKNSDYTAHFIIFGQDGKHGNWVDFEGIGNDYVVNKVSDYEYNIVFSNLPLNKEITLNSIGGLNIVTENYKWYRGNYTTFYSNPATAGSTQHFLINFTRNQDYINDINASFYYNYTQRSITKTINESYFLFTSSFVVPEYQIDYNFSWDANISQNTEPIYNLTVEQTQSVLLAFINITFYDEENQSIINTEKIDVFLTLEQTTTGSTSSGSIIIGNLTLGEYYIQATSNTSYPMRGIYATLTNQTTNINMYLVYDTIGNDYIDYTIKDTQLNSVEDARLTFRKTINSSLITVAQFETDYAGQGRLFQDQQNEYDIIITHSNYPTKQLTLLPLNLEYTILLDISATDYYTNIFEGIRYTISPKYLILNVTQTYYNVSIDMYSGLSDLQYFGVFIDGHNYVCDPVSCKHNVSGSPAGGSAVVKIYANYTGEFDVHYFYKRIGHNIQYLHGSKYSVLVLLVGKRFAGIINEIEQNVSPFLRSIIAAFFITMICVLGASFGIAGIALVGVAVFGTIFFALIQWIEPIIGIICMVLGVAAFVFLGRDD